jgi:integrase
MSLPQTDYFDANLPGASQTVRIASLYDAKVAAKRNRHGQRDATMILICFRHGLRASELCELQWSDLRRAQEKRAFLAHRGMNVHRALLIVAQQGLTLFAFLF